MQFEIRERESDEAIKRGRGRYFVVSNGFHTSGNYMKLEEDEAKWLLDVLQRLLTQHAPDAGDSAASTDSLQASALSASETDTTPPQRG